MVTAETYAEIARGLLAKTQAEKSKWQRSGPEDDRAFRLELPKSKVILRFSSPRTEPDAILLDLCRGDGIPVGTWTVQEGDEDWQLARKLYAEVQRRVVGWSEVLEDIEKYLRSD